MEAKELRIGNYLRDMVSKTTLEVIELTKDDIVTYVIDRNKFPLKEGWGLEPIPLTEEWLLKFRFDKRYHTDSNDCYYHQDSDITLFLKSDVRGINFPYVMINRETIKVEFVHQLQNLYFAIKRHELECN